MMITKGLFIFSGMLTFIHRLSNKRTINAYYCSTNRPTFENYLQFTN